MTDTDEHRRLAEARWNKDWGPSLSSRRKLISIIVFCVAFFGIIAMVFNSASYN